MKFIACPEEAGDYPWPDIRVLGVDPSMTSTGWGIVRFFPGTRPSVVAHGTIKTEPTGEQNMQDNVVRSGIIFRGIQDVVRCYYDMIDEVSIELPVPVLGVSSQSGSMMVVAAHAAVLGLDKPIGMYYPNHTKKVVALNGRAEKQDVKSAVFEWIGREFKTNTDVTDGIAAALCHVIDKGGLDRA